MTRAERQSQNRTLLLQAGQRLFLRDGFHGTSLSAVAAEAGVSTGAVYSNFTGKAELAMLVLTEIQQEQLNQLSALIGVDAPLADRIERFREWCEVAFASGWPMLELEVALEVRQDPALVPQAAARHRTATDLTVRALEVLVPPSVKPLVSLPALAEALVSTVIGMAVRRLIDPAARPDMLIDAARDLLLTLGVE